MKPISALSNPEDILGDIADYAVSEEHSTEKGFLTGARNNNRESHNVAGSYYRHPFLGIRKVTTLFISEGSNRTSRMDDKLEFMLRELVNMPFCRNYDR